MSIEPFTEKKITEYVGEAVEVAVTPVKPKVAEIECQAAFLDVLKEHFPYATEEKREAIAKLLTGTVVSLKDATSKLSSQEQLDKELKDLKPTAPTVTLRDLQDNIEDIEICKFVTRKGKVLRWAIINTPSGFGVTGKPSVAVCAENDRPEFGIKTAIQNAKEEMWGFMGYELSCRLHRESQVK